MCIQFDEIVYAELFEKYSAAIQEIIDKELLSQQLFGQDSDNTLCLLI